MKVIVFGSTGLTGAEIVERLLTAAPVTQLVLPVRSPKPALSPKCTTSLMDFDAELCYRNLMPADAVICSLGTTIKKAGSQEQFRKVDYDYPLKAAEIALAHGVAHFLLISALGADSRSPIFYSRVKGELEDAICRLPFASISIFRPSLLLGDRHEFRLGERLMQMIAPLVIGKYRPVQASAVADAVAESLLNPRSGIRIWESSEINKQFGRK